MSQAGPDSSFLFSFMTHVSPPLQQTDIFSIVKCNSYKQMVNFLESNVRTLLRLLDVSLLEVTLYLKKRQNVIQNFKFFIILYCNYYTKKQRIVLITGHFLSFTVC